jgi:hypothetical protein
MALRRPNHASAIAVIVAAGVVVAACSNSPSSSNARSGSTPSSSNPPSSSTAAPSSGNPSTPPRTMYSSVKATVIGMSTDVVINPAVSAALKNAGIRVTADAPASGKTTLLFPVSGGQITVATLVGTIDHAGGLTFSHSGKSVTLTNFVINTDTKQLTGTIGGQSIPIFGLNLSSPVRASGPHGILVASNVKLTVISQAAAVLNSGVGVSTFKAGMNFGVATLTVAYARGHR